MDRLIKVTDKNTENIAVFFSGIISSFISAILSMILTTTNFVDNVLVRIALILAVFLFIWFILAKYVIPFIKNAQKERAKTIAEDLPNQDVIDFFKSSIVLTAFEIEDALNIILGEENDISCIKSSTVVVVSEYIKCVNYIAENIKENHIRSYDEKEEKDFELYINEYTLIHVYDILSDVGEKLQNIFSVFDRSANDIKLLIYDFEASKNKFIDHRKLILKESEDSENVIQ